MFGDIVVLDKVTKDNIDDGKSIEYFKWMIDGLPDPKPQFGTARLAVCYSAQADFSSPQHSHEDG